MSDKRPRLRSPFIMHLLKWPSLLYLRLMALRSALYERGIFRSRRLNAFVVSIGNLSLGGSGKTPTTVLMATWAKERGYPVCVISRGYGGRLSSRRPVVVSDGSKVFHGPRDVGDEPFMMAKKLYGVPIVISKERYWAGIWARELFGTNFLVLDDGFQHLRLKRDLDVLLLSPKNLRDTVLPLGRLREPLCAIQRAHMVILLQAERREGSGWAPGLNGFRGPVFFGEQRPVGVLSPGEDRVYDLGFLKGKRLVAFCGIASPERFLEAIEEMGGLVMSFRAFRDHHFYTREEILGLKGNLKAGEFLITTEKDWARLWDMQDLFGNELLVLKTEMHLMEKERFFQLVNDCYRRWLIGEKRVF